MKDVKQILADNIIKLRKKHNMTQTELAERVNYSDNAVSRWERAEVTPSIETLQKISEVFRVPFPSLFEEEIPEINEKEEKQLAVRKLSVILIFVSLIWLIATITFVYGQLIFDKNFWQVFIWAVPCSCLILLPFNAYWGKYVYKFVIFSVFQWSLLACVYLQFIQYNLWLIFLIGIPLQVALAIWAFIRPRSKDRHN